MALNRFVYLWAALTFSVIIGGCSSGLMPPKEPLGAKRESPCPRCGQRFS